MLLVSEINSSSRVYQTWQKKFAHAEFLVGHEIADEEIPETGFDGHAVGPCQLRAVGVPTRNLGKNLSLQEEESREWNTKVDTKYYLFVCMYYTFIQMNNLVHLQLS